VRLLLASLLLYATPLIAQVELEGFKNGKRFAFQAEAIPDTDLSNGKIWLQQPAAQAFKELVVAAAKYGYHLEINYGFRTHQQQAYWYNKFQNRCKDDSAYCDRAALPGYSTHEEGRSLDISGCTRLLNKADLEQIPTHCSNVSDEKVSCKTTLYWWLKKEAPKYGFYNDVPHEPWHWTFYQPDNIEVGG
jgi:LAS superfamily LD-carboxypeptidase LdcB